MKKAILTLAMAVTCTIAGLVGFSHTAKAATAAKNFTTFNVNSFTETKKIGSYYITNKYDDYKVKKSAKGKELYTIKATTGTLASDGTYAYYVNEKDNSLCKMTLANKKTVKLTTLKGKGYWISHVYGNSIYLNRCNSDDSCTISVFNAGDKSMKAIVKDADTDSLCGYGSTLLYKSMTDGNVYLRNCNSGEVTRLDALKGATSCKIYKNKIAFVKYNKKAHQYTVYTYNTSTKKITTVKNIGKGYETAYGDFSDNLGKYTFRNKVLNMNTKAIKKTSVTK